MRFAAARSVADAVLFEGYLLYPYRASSTKNRWRWTFGVLAPKQWTEAGGCEPCQLECQCLVEGGAGTHLNGRLRFLHVEQRLVESRGPDGCMRPAPSLDTPQGLIAPWEEGCVTEIDFVFALGGEPAEHSFEVVGQRREEVYAQGRVTWERAPLRGVIRTHAEQVEAQHPLWRLHVQVENLTPCPDASASRSQAVRSSTVATHLMFAVTDGAFVSVLDPPQWASHAARHTRSTGTYPVLAGRAGDRSLLLSAPIILYDHPQVAPESPGDFFDACEIDELLALRVTALTDAERLEAYATEPRAAELLDRVKAMPPEMRVRLHGALRDLRDGEMIPRHQPPAPKQPASRYPRGTRVRLRPRPGRTDAQDFLYAGRIATVEAVRRDHENREYLAVIIEDDPAADLNRWYGRYLYYYPHEVEDVPPQQRVTP